MEKEFYITQLSCLAYNFISGHLGYLKNAQNVILAYRFTLKEFKGHYTKLINTKVYAYAFEKINEKLLFYKNGISVKPVGIIGPALKRKIERPGHCTK